MTTYSEMNVPPMIEAQVSQAFEELSVDKADKQAIEDFLAPLKEKDANSYEHSLRVGLLARNIGKYLGMREKPLLFSGLMHDLGKIVIPDEILKKTENWTEEDAKAIEQHVLSGYEKIKGRFDFTAEIVLLHHRFQKKQYPEILPEHLHDYSEETKKQIFEYGRILAIADVYDALHRKNSKYGESKYLTDEEIKEKMLEGNTDRADLIESLYKAGIFQ